MKNTELQAWYGLKNLFGDELFNEFTGFKDQPLTNWEKFCFAMEVGHILYTDYADVINGLDEDNEIPSFAAALWKEIQKRDYSVSIKTIIGEFMADSQKQKNAISLFQNLSEDEFVNGVVSGKYLGSPSKETLDKANEALSQSRCEYPRLKNVYEAYCPFWVAQKENDYQFHIEQYSNWNTFWTAIVKYGNISIKLGIHPYTVLKSQIICNCYVGNILKQISVNPGDMEWYSRLEKAISTMHNGWEDAKWQKRLEIGMYEALCIYAKQNGYNIKGPISDIEI